MSARFSLHRRHGQWYAQLYSHELGKYLTARCTGERSRNSAELVVLRWQAEGWPTGRHATPRPVDDVLSVDTLLAQIRGAPLTPEDAGRILDALRTRDLIEGGAVAKGGPGAELVTDCLERMWTCESSPYVREKHAHGQQIGQRRCVDALSHVRAHWKPYFEGKRLAEVTRADLSDFGIQLREQDLMAKSINNTLEPGTVALRWAYNNGMLTSDPTRGLRRFSGDTKARGVLTLAEAEALFRLAWKDERSRVGSLLAATTGLRNGEVLAVRARDIGAELFVDGNYRLRVQHSWSDLEGLKSTKTGEERTVPLLPAVREDLLALLATSPHDAGADRFVFYGTSADRPMRADFLRVGLAAALLALSLPEPADRQDEEKARTAKASWRARGVVFHSWRHFYASRMSDRADERVVRLATGHASSLMHEHYSSHRTEDMLRQAGEAAAKAFGQILPFAGKVASA